MVNELEMKNKARSSQKNRKKFFLKSKNVKKHIYTHLNSLTIKKSIFISLRHGEPNNKDNIITLTLKL